MWMDKSVVSSRLDITAMTCEDALITSSRRLRRRDHQATHTTQVFEEMSITQTRTRAHNHTGLRPMSWLFDKGMKKPSLILVIVNDLLRCRRI